jgi:hypothetical protein
MVLWKLGFSGAVYLALSASAVPAQDLDKALFQCSFDTECYAKEPCNSSAFDVALKSGPSDGLFALSTEFGEIEGLAVALNSYLAVNERTAYLLTFSKPESILTVHMQEEPAVITYYGNCDWVE